MSEKLLKFLLSEFKIVRLVCKGTRPQKKGACGFVFELPIKDLSDMPPNCPICNTTFYGGDTANPVNHFKSFADAIQAVSALSGQVEVEFVLPDKPD